jgi:hypothetical protein
MSALGPAMMFISLLLAEGLLGAGVLIYAARCFGVIVEATAAGDDQVTWPDEPMMDWLGRALHLCWLVAFWLVPVAVLLRLLRHFNPEGSPVLFLLAPVLLFWLLFPVSVLSSLSAHSRWVFFRPALVGGLFRVFPATAAFYFVTALLVGGLAALGWVTFVSGWFLLIPVLAAGAAAGLFVYARLLGRLGLVLGQIEAPEVPQTEAPAAERPRPRRPPRKRRPVRGVKTVDPWAVPEPEEETPPEPSSSVEGYGVAHEESARPAAKPPAEGRRKKKPRPKGYAMSGEEPPPLPETPLDGFLPVGEESPDVEGAVRRDRPKDLPARSARREQPTRRPAEPALAHPFLQGVYTFPWYPNSLAPWLVVAGGVLGVGLLAQAMLSFWAQLQ